MSLPLMNVFEIVVEGVTHHLICFLDPVLAGARGIDSRWTVGEYTPRTGSEFDLETFRPNPDFVVTFTDYMNERAAHAPEIAAQAARCASAWLYLIDPRYPNQADDDPPATEILGCFAVDEAGQIVPRSFQYNRNHLWIEPTRGVSKMLMNREFYDWLHPVG